MAANPIDRRAIGVLAIGHLAADLSQGVVPPLLPFLIHERGYSFAAAGALFLFSSLGSSLIQPLLGAFADRIHASWLMPVGSLLAAIGVVLVGWMPSYLTTGLALAIASVGIAMYHPEGVRYASWVSAASGRQGTGMSFFAVGGMSGWALGPILVTPLALIGGLRATSLIAVVPLVVAVVLWRALPTLARYRPTPGSLAAAASDTPSDWGVFSLAAAAASLRTGMHFGVQAFVPLYLWHVLGSSEATANAAGTTLLVTGAVGTLIGGRLADRYGFRRVVVWSFLTVVPLVAAITVAPVWGVFALMGAVGLVEEMNFYPLVVVAQRAVPRHVGFASGVVLGLSIGFGALTTALLGVLADHQGLRATIVAEAALMATAFLFAVALPRAPRTATT